MELVLIVVVAFAGVALTVDLPTVDRTVLVVVEAVAFVLLLILCCCIGVVVF